MQPNNLTTKGRKPQRGNNMSSVQSVLQELDQWHELVKPEMELAEYLAMYQGFVREEWKELQEANEIGEIVKEACDYIVVNRPLITHGTGHMMKLHHHSTESVKGMLSELGVNWWQALEHVTASNLSKLILECETEAASDFFAHAGIDVRIESIGHGYFGAYSMLDQAVSGKFYAKDKLLKCQNYFEIDESKEWWK